MATFKGLEDRIKEISAKIDLGEEHLIAAVHKLLVDLSISAETEASVVRQNIIAMSRLPDSAVKDPETPPAAPQVVPAMEGGLEVPEAPTTPVNDENQGL